MKRTIILLLTFGFLGTVHGGNGGSGYSRYGIGDIQYFVSSRADGMGGAGIALLSATSIDQINPAAWVGINHTRYAVGLLYQGYSTTDGQESGYFSGANFNGFMLALPVSPSRGIVFGAGIVPYSTINYSINYDTSGAGLAYRLGYKGEGGASDAQVGLSANISNTLFGGVKLHYYFGTLRHTITQDFTDNSLYTNAVELRSTNLSGLGLSFGAIYSGLNSLLRLDSTNSLTVGLVVSTASNVTTHEEHQFTFATPSLTTHDTETVGDGTLRIPFSAVGGISYITRKFLAASDLSFQQWSKFDAGGSILPANRDSYRWSVGGEWLPSREASSTFSERLAYRLGFFYSATYYRVNDHAINEIGVTGGMGLPIFFGTRLDIGVQYSSRGTVNQGLQKDNILRVSFTLSGDELWFVRPPEE